MTTEDCETVLANLGAEFGVSNAETFALGEAEDTNLAFVQVVVHLVGRFADLVALRPG